MIAKERIKKAGIWCLAVALFAMHVLIRSTAHAAEPDSWKPIYARSGDCQISFPTKPKMIQQALTVSEEGDQLTYDIYLAPIDEQALCLLLVAVYPYQLRNGNELAGIEGLLKGIVGHHPANKLVFAKVVDRNGRQAVDFLVQSPSSYFRGQALMNGNRLYLFAIEGKVGEMKEDIFTKFSTSFSLLNQSH